jgi:hypothetical protein
MLTLALFLQYYNSIGCYTVIPRTANSHESYDNGLVHTLKWETSCVDYTHVLKLLVYEHTQPPQNIFLKLLLLNCFLLYSDVFCFYACKHMLQGFKTRTWQLTLYQIFTQWRFPLHSDIILKSWMQCKNKLLIIIIIIIITIKVISAIHGNFMCI